jgi:hypothetical protein
MVAVYLLEGVEGTLVACAPSGQVPASLAMVALGGAEPTSAHLLEAIRKVHSVAELLAACSDGPACHTGRSADGAHRAVIAAQFEDIAGQGFARVALRLQAAERTIDALGALIEALLGGVEQDRLSAWDVASAGARLRDALAHAGTLSAQGTPCASAMSAGTVELF